MPWRTKGPKALRGGSSPDGQMLRSGPVRGCVPMGLRTDIVQKAKPCQTKPLAGTCYSRGGELGGRCQQVRREWSWDPWLSETQELVSVVDWGRSRLTGREVIDGLAALKEVQVTPWSCVYSDTRLLYWQSVSASCAGQHTGRDPRAVGPFWGLNIAFTGVTKGHQKTDICITFHNSSKITIVK